ncbi:ABC transporter substrate-binding protein [Natronobeatus ordinarius]|uniref:ABC transporter substrate-binding protein n=1 Tax=Natronobeatus ordinarius TaxID=2963433 RepID=UPI0020CCB6EC|nr:ABC transporter substrate-binding protein [Natronobeatus ordinarius]
MTVGGLAGCLGQRESDVVRVGYVPVYPNLQHFVMDEAGHYDELPVEIGYEKFDTGTGLNTAFAAGDIDIGHFAIVPAFSLVQQDQQVRALAVNNVNGIKLLGSEAVAECHREHGNSFLDAYQEQHGRPRIAIPGGKGGAPHLVVHRWITAELGYDRLDAVLEERDVAPPRTVEAIHQGEVDLVANQEPFATSITRDPGYTSVAWSGEIIENHPLSVMLANGRVREDTDLRTELLDRHRDATELIRAEPETAASHAASGMGIGDELAQAVTTSRAYDFETSPDGLRSSVETIGDILVELEIIDQAPTAEELFASDVLE